MSGHILVDFDGTLAYHVESGYGLSPDPMPIPKMLEKVMKTLGKGIEVRIFTARASVPELIPEVEAWCLKHIGQKLRVTNQKDFGTIEIWDDRAREVLFNEGVFKGEEKDFDRF